MSNELRDIAERLNKNYEDEGWKIETAEKRADGGWNLVIQPMEKAPKAVAQEATDENN